MPKFREDVSLDQHNVGHFGFTAVSLNELESSGYTLATIVCDRSGSTDGFQQAMEDAVKGSVEMLKKLPEAESIMLRMLTIDDTCEEQHGFIPLADINTDRYNGMLAPRGVTALFDGCVNAAEGSTNFGLELRADRYKTNGILIVITDGGNNAGRFRKDSDVVYVKKAFEETRRKEALESFATALVAVNSGQYTSILRKFHDDAGFTIPMIETTEVARIGKFITNAVSSTSTSLGTGGASTAIKF